MNEACDCTFCNQFMVNKRRIFTAYFKIQNQLRFKISKKLYEISRNCLDPSIQKQQQIKPFSAVAFGNFVSFSQCSFSGFLNISPLILRHKQVLVIFAWYSYTAASFFLADQQKFLHFATWNCMIFCSIQLATTVSLVTTLGV